VLQQGDLLAVGEQVAAPHAGMVELEEVPRNF